ncbi:hypothetical protein F2P79_003449 [Pimephales promelas]|nr:hypothetical protein F2P79_003449 [Pimephales promelas]
MYKLKTFAEPTCSCSYKTHFHKGVHPTAGVVLFQAISTPTSSCLKVNYWLWSSFRWLHHTSNPKHSQTQTSHQLNLPEHLLNFLHFSTKHC